MAKLSDENEATYAFGRQPERFYVSKRFPEGGEPSVPGARPCRFSYQVFDQNEDVVFENANAWDVVVRETTTRQQLKALFFEDTRKIKSLVFQRFNAKGKPLNYEHFVLSGEEVLRLASFFTLTTSATLALAEEDGVRVLPGHIDALLADADTQQQVFERYKAVLVQFLEDDVNAPEIIALARRRQQLSTFERLLYDSDVFVTHRDELRDAGRQYGKEAVWQQFFDSNHWIFGSGLATQFLHSWDPRKLEQTTVGASVFGPGKKPDALMRSAGALSAIALVEIKHHETPLLSDKPYRSGVWRVSEEVAGGVAQCQTTVDKTVHAARELQALDNEGFPTSERALICRPRSILVVGSLDQFVGAHGHNLEMFESFERFRRSIRDPEIVTFDELFERARLVLDISGPS